ncbi:MAG: isopentenyl phosphate kinase [archaeon]
MMGLKLLKIGGSVITERKAEEPTPREKQMERVAKEVSEAYTNSMKLILIHGAGSYGHPIVKRTGISKGMFNEEDRVNFAETQRLQNELNSLFTKKLIEEDVPAFPFQASASAVRRGTLKKMEVNLIKKLLDEGIVPVLYGVPAYDEEQGCSILSGDEIMPYLANELDAELMLHGTDVKGVYTSDPSKDPSAEFLEEINSFEEAESYLGGSKHTDVTGGMLNKIEKAFKLRVDALIFNASKENNVKRALLEESVGTYINVA